MEMVGHGTENTGLHGRRFVIATVRIFRVAQEQEIR